MFSASKAVRFSDCPARRAIRRDLPQGGWLRFELDGAGALMAACGIGPGNAVAKDIRLAEKLIQRGAAVAPEVLADSSVNLKSVLQAA